MAVTVRDRGAAKMLAAARARQPAALVGVLGELADQPAGDGDVTVGQIAEWAEFGIGQPMRSWLRAWIDESQAEIKARMEAESQAVIQGAITPHRAAQRLGVWAVGQIQLRISAGIAPPNADSTIEKKGSSTPLIDTGQLRSSITNQVEE